jgi:hypothetical protein
LSLHFTLITILLYCADFVQTGLDVLGYGPEA